MKKCKRVVLSLMLAVMVLVFSPQLTKAQEKQNNYPVIFVHGLIGWGPDEMLGYKYWGGFNDVVKNLNNQGTRSYAAVVGPVSSNWDRAVELYYYIKGGRVDYGAAHAKKEKHERFGRTFPGLYSQWDGTNKIHLVGHSMGGLTSRQLANFLEDGSAEEREYANAHPDEGISDLFQGGTHSIHSITTIATPNSGTSFAQDENAFVGFSKKLLTKVAEIAGMADSSFGYDFKLDQFGLRRQPEERFMTYVDRVYNSSIWKTKDISSYDLSVRGVTANQEHLKTKSDIYYFSYTGIDTRKSLLSDNHVPMVSLDPLLYPSAIYIGEYTDYTSVPPIDKSWAASDGVVNVVSSYYPLGHPAKPYDGDPEKGKWSYYPAMSDWDHLNYMGIGAFTTAKEINNFYSNATNTVQALPR